MLNQFYNNTLKCGRADVYSVKVSEIKPRIWNYNIYDSVTLKLHKGVIEMQQSEVNHPHFVLGKALILCDIIKEDDSPAKENGDIARVTPKHLQKKDKRGVR